MAKEYRRSTDSSEKRTFGAKKRSANTQRESSGKQRREKGSDEEDRPARRSGERKPFVKKSKKREEEPSFKRYRDQGKPSDFGSGKRGGEDRPFTKRSGSGDRSSNKGRYGDKPFNKEKSVRNKPFSDERGVDRPFTKRSDSGDRPFNKDDSGNKPFKEKSEFSAEDRPFNKRSGSKDGSFKSFRDKSYSPKKKKEANPYDLDESDFEFAEEDNFDEAPVRKGSDKRKPGQEKHKTETSGSKKDDGLIRLNKYISNAGICSRREADELIASGVVQVNGKIITEMGYKVKPSDVIKYGGQTLKKERMVYLILNKPKDYITTVDDPQKRKTVLELVQDACRERIYPVGRLDRSTTGLLMFTNDGELTKKLTHPKYGVRKIYHVELDKPLKKQDFDQIMEGMELEDGQIKVDEISYVGDGKDKSQVGVELHSGKNRIVRRIFEHLGYNVRKLDRVMFGPLTKKDLPRGRWRFLTQAEIGIMNMISSD